MIDRPMVLDKLTRFLDKEISAQDIYEWAFGIRMSPNYQTMRDNDPLLAAVIVDLVELGHPENRRRPQEQKFKQYRSILAQQPQNIPTEYVPPADESGLSSDKATDRSAAVWQATAMASWKQKPAQDNVFVLVARIYTWVFGLFSLSLHAVYLFFPRNLLEAMGLFIIEDIWNIFPPMVHAVVLLMPFRVLSRKTFFALSFLALLLGAGYYWYLTVMIVQEYQTTWYVTMLLSPVAALPSTIALFLFVHYNTSSE